MELPDVVSVRKFREFSLHQKEELYETLLELSDAIEEIPKKSLRKALDLTLAVLRFKGEQVKELQQKLQTDSEDESPKERLIDENEKLKRMFGKLEHEKQGLKDKAKELSHEIHDLQRRLQNATNLAESSDKDSSDPLSELDKKEELLRNINTKNKHIKRLLREIEALQCQNIEQSKSLIGAEKVLQATKAKLQEVTAESAKCEKERKSLKDTLNELGMEIIRLEGNITYLEEDREQSEQNYKTLVEKLEANAKAWKQKLDEKEHELSRLKERVEKEYGDSSLIATDDNSKGDDAKAKRDRDTKMESTKFLHVLEIRDKHIEDLEEKIKSMAAEMLTSTKLMNKISAEKENERNSLKPRACCKLVRDSLEAANARCQELAEMLERSEEQHRVQSQQTLEVTKTLNAYQRGEDGLAQTLQKCSKLEQKIATRDTEIRTLIQELNSMHEIAYENSILRKRLNVPDDVIITAKNLSAKGRSKDKIIERLSLKLRASEEMRLQLKLEVTDCRKYIIDLQKLLQDCDHKNSADSRRLLSDIGELGDSKQLDIETSGSNSSRICIKCKGSLDTPDDEEYQSGEEEHTHRYGEILAENETLRLGMHEILEKLREYDACSDHITIDTTILVRLLRTFEVPVALEDPNCMQNQQYSFKECEDPNEELTNLDIPSFSDSTATYDLTSVESIRDGSEIQNRAEDTILVMPNIVESPTHPASPRATDLNESTAPVVNDTKPTPESRELQQQISELRVYQSRYEQLKAQLVGGEEELQRYSKELIEQVTSLELELAKTNSRYSFMREDFDRVLTATKQSELRHIQEVTTLKKDMHAQAQDLSRLQTEHKLHSNACRYNDDEYQSLQKSHAELAAQLAYLVDQVLAGRIEQQFQVKELCTDYGIIRENLQLDYITMEEYEKQLADLKLAAEKEEELRRKTLQLEGLLEIAHQQIQSQQRLLNEITDNHINLRHLVADLQSNTEEKLLLAKMQRDLDTAKTDISNLKIERDELQQTTERLQINLKSEKQTTQELNQLFKTERSHKDIKIKFLQKSLLMIKEKYSKFTPLVFLTNFIFSYTKFAKSSTEPQDVSANVNVLQMIEEIVHAKLLESNYNMDDSESLIKLIKVETQCKLLEEANSSLQNKYNLMKQECTEQRIRYAQECEHWQTIEALFDPNKASAKPTEAVADIADGGSQSNFKHVATNTDTPVPAERRSQAKLTERRSSVVEFMDKNTSPIGSPMRRGDKDVREIATQTIHADEAPPKEIDTKPPTEPVGLPVKKATAEAVVQTTNANMESQAVQTVPSDDVCGAALSDPSPVERQEAEHQQSPQKTEREEDVLLMQTRNELQAAELKIEELQQKLLDSAQKTTNPVGTVPDTAEERDFNEQSGIIEKTILSFHTLLTEKDKSISKLQDLLHDERDHYQTASTKLLIDIEGLKATVNNLNFTIKTKDMEILELKTKLEVLSIRRNSNEKLDLATGGAEVDDNGDNSLNELSDEKIEEMFQQNGVGVGVGVSGVSAEKANAANEPATSAADNEEKQDKETLKEIPALLKQIKELKDKTTYWESTLKVKEDEIALLKEKVSLYQEREKSVEGTVNPEIEQLRGLLEEKDKHIQDLMDTLKSFHDDQERYINDSSNYSADQISQLAADLTRSEATNKIYQTQVDALRRQLTSLTQREKQSRELNQSLRTQLIKRPVVSIKTELNARVKTENLQKRIQQLELELEEARAQIQRQQIMLDAKRARSSSEVGLWEKQKRYQQSAEKFKTKLEETEAALEKTRALLQSARSTIARLEKDKQVLEGKLARVSGSNPGQMMPLKCCRTPSCPNTHQSGAAGGCAGAKYTPSESPETYTGASSECSSPAHSVAGGAPPNGQFCNHAHANLAEALKARIEMQQRKILAMELEGKGTNALTTEIEKLQEKYSAIEAQNIRLEARNLQLQLDNDLMHQGDATERLQKRITHLEDYIIALKEEIAHSEARRQLCKCNGVRMGTQQSQPADRTILSLRSIVEKLRAENKYLKDGGGRRSCDSRSGADTSSGATTATAAAALTKTTADVGRLQQMYTEALETISALQKEHNTQTRCSICSNREKTDMHYGDELQYTKEQLLKKTQLLQKAKVLLTRAAAKEKVLKEQLSLWKRKCSELQNVPVIDEISE